MAYMQPPQQGIPRLLAMKDPTNPILMHMSPMEAAQITAMRGQGFNPQTGLPVLGRAEGGMLQPEKPPYADIAQELEEKGRFGDTHLLHVRDDELQGLSSLGQLTVNPDTGLPEAFSFKSLIPALVGTAVTIASGGTMAPLMAAGMGGLATFGTSMAMGNSLEQSLLSGFMTFGGGAIAGGGPSFGVEAGAGGGVLDAAGGAAADMGLASAGQMATTTTGTGLAGNAASAFNMTGMGAAVDGVTNAAAAVPFQGMGTYMPLADQAAFLASTPSAGQENLLYDGFSPNRTAGLNTPQTYVEDVAFESILDPATLDPATNFNEMYNTTNAAQRLSNAPLTAKPATAIDMYKLQGETGPLGRIDPKTVGKPYEQGFINRGAGKLDISPTESLTRSELISRGTPPPDATIMEKFQAFGNNPAKMAKGIGIPVAGAILTADPYIPPESEDLESTFSTYTPRERTLVGSRPRSETFEEIQERMLRGAGDTQFQPFSPHRFVNEGGLVGLAEGGQAKEFIDQYELNKMSITPESQRVRGNTFNSEPQKEDISNRFFNEMENKGGVMRMVSHLLLRNNPEAVQFINQNASIPSSSFGNNLSSFDTGVKGLYPKAEGGLVGLNRGGRPREGGPPTGLPPDTGLQANSFARGLMMAMNRITGEKQKEEQQKGTTGLTGLNEGGMLNANYPRYNSGSTIGFNDGGQPKMPTLPVSLQAIMKRLNVENYSPFLEFADKTEEIESRGGEDRINKKSSARGNFQWLTKVDPNAKKGKHGSVKTAVNRTLSSYKDMGQDIPEWLNTLNKNSTKSTEDLEKNILSLTPEQERELFWGNMNKQTGSDGYLSKIAAGDQQAMIDAYSIFHHTEGKTHKPTAEKAKEIFLAESTTTTTPNMGLASLPQEKIIVEGMEDTRPDKKYTVQSGDTLSQLAADSGMSVEDIMKANLGRISDPDKIYAGQQIALSDSPDIPNPVRMDSEGDKTSTDSLLETVKKIIPNFSAGGGIGQYYAQGGSTGQYYEGQVIGQGDGMSDEILFEVEGNNPDKALLSRDEYVIPADVVAMLGNGSSNAGAEQLDSFMRNIRQQSFGTPEQQQQMNPQQGLSQLV
jgi:LysM repeat protein